ncbi:MAG: class B sortase [Blautia sp.]|nr:class B sortase [Blautia sp.]MDY3999507.1 class B sortase [Blautia sp.]NCB93168.1 class B sortase [Clostridia bacterium]
MRKILGICLLISSIGMIAWSGLNAYSLFMKYKEGRDSYQEAEKYVEVQVQNQEEIPDRAEEENISEKLTAPISVNLEELKKRNPDVKGWIYIESIDLSYPILQGTDNEYYLTHSWDKQEIFAASIFMDYRNRPDFRDYNTVIYGHNMKDGSMFHNIQYCMEQEHYEKSPYIWVLTSEGDYQYEIFSEYDTRYDSDTYTLFWEPGEKLTEYIRKMQGLSLWESRVQLGETEHILTLSTCNGEHDLRRIVQAKRVS